MSVHGLELVADAYRQTILHIPDAALADLLEGAARRAQHGLLKRPAVLGTPSEGRVAAFTDVALFVVFGFEHSDAGIRSEASIAKRGEGNVAGHYVMSKFKSEEK